MERNEYDDYFPPFSPFRKLVREQWNEQPENTNWYDFLEKKANKLHKIETYLPVFPGFYSTAFEADEDMEIENINEDRQEKGLQPIEFDEIEFNYELYRINVAVKCCEYVEREMSDFISAVNFQAVSSPREYNFSNNSINIAVILSDENIEAIKKYLKDNLEAFSADLKEKYTSHSGFIPFYSNEVSEWLKSIDECLEHSHKLGSILDFIMNNEIDDPEYWMRDNCFDIYVEVLNYDELINV